MKKNKIFGTNQKVGLILIGLSIIIWLLRPFQSCKWYEFACHGGNTASTPVFFILAGILLIAGVIKLLRKNRK